jgi:hypothetical protein
MSELDSGLDALFMDRLIGCAYGNERTIADPAFGRRLVN